MTESARQKIKFWPTEEESELLRLGLIVISREDSLSFTKGVIG